MESIFSKEIRSNLPRVLSLIDNDRTSLSHGMADRYYWAWGLIDFGNATLQGLAHGLARVWVSGLWPYKADSESFLSRIDSLFLGAKNLSRKDGSLEEAFPNEGSYCVTALVAFDLLVAIDLLGKSIDGERRERWLRIIEPMIRYLIKNDETHALISNHLATASAALFRWNIMNDGDEMASAKGKVLLDRILENQSQEGWFREYEGADPGYQSLCTYYLADIHLNDKSLNLLEPLSRSIKFLWYFAHPDGSFGGYYGSRSTRFYYPGGILALGEEIPEAKSLTGFMIKSIAESKLVGLSSMDEPNLSPMFNSYAWAASCMKEIPDSRDSKPPCHSAKPFRKDFPEAGIIIDRGYEHYSVINYKKGGVAQHYIGGSLNLIDTGVVFENTKKRLGSTQHFDLELNVEINETKIEISNQVVEMPKKLSSPFKFLILRIFCLTIFRSASIREYTKGILVKYLITKPKKWPISNKREILFGKELAIIDRHEEVSGFNKLNARYPFVPIHMASKGYWQVQDESFPK